MIETHDEVELVDVLTLLEAVSECCPAVTGQMLADVHLAILWFCRNANFSGVAADHPLHDGMWDWHWDGPVVLEKLSARGPGSLARFIVDETGAFREKHVKAWIAQEENWRLK